MMQAVHQLVDEAESEIAKDVDLIGKRLALLGGNVSVKIKPDPDAETTATTSD